MISLFKNIDIFGRTYELSFNNQPLFKTMYGGVITILCFSLIIVSTYFLSSELFVKINPNMISRSLPSPNRVNLTFNVNVAYMVEDNYGNYLPNAFQYLSINPVYYQILYEPIADGTYQANINTSTLSWAYCLPTDFHPENLESYNDNNLFSAYCVDDTNSGGIL